jgi:two-component system sensor histidine kinase MtrB
VIGSSALRGVSTVGLPLISRWRRSIQFRVVATTLLLSAVVVALLGFVVLNQVRDGLLNAKQRVALAETGAGLAVAQQELDAADRTDPSSLDQLLDQLVGSLANRGGAALYDVAILQTDAGGAAFGSAGLTSCDVRCAGSVPSTLRSYVTQHNTAAYKYAVITRASGDRQPGLIVGGQLTSANAGNFELYYLFPLGQEQNTLGLVRRTLAFAGLVLVLLLAVIAALVTRQVVAPVRAAARTAEQLSAGRLEERMTVRGEDDLARLATSFNAMAAGLQSQIGQLKELSLVQRQFVSDVSHELRTPLTTVRMAADVIHENRAAFDPAVARSAELLQAQLDRFEALLGDLLEISRHDARAVVLDAEAANIHALVDQVVAAAEPLAQRRGSVVRVDASSASSVVADVDARRVERILRNLLINAVEHGDGREIIVTLGSDDDAIAVSVRDHGVGLRPGETGLVFNRFWRGDPARARTTGGTGLGLSIALEDARLHGGWLQAWGEPGKGAMFRLTLPRRAGETLHSSPLPLQPDDAYPTVNDVTPVTPKPSADEPESTATPSGRGSGPHA